MPGDCLGIDFVVNSDYNRCMDVFQLTKSVARRKLFELFLADPDQSYYLHEIARNISVSAGNIRRDLGKLISLGLFTKVQHGRLVYYKIVTGSPLFSMIQSLVNQSPGVKDQNDTVREGLLWAGGQSPTRIRDELYCRTRDVFTVRLQSFTLRLAKLIGADAYLVSAVAGEIGNNSFDHNLGNWKDVPGIYFAHDAERKLVVLADRGQGILSTIRRVRSEVSDDRSAMDMAFTKVISGRFPEQRGNGLKFVVSVLRDKQWSLLFMSGHAKLSISKKGDMKISETKREIPGCLAIIDY